MSNNFITGILVSAIIALIVCMAVLGINVYNDVLGETQELASGNVTGFSKIETKEDVETPQIVESYLDTPEEANSNIQYQSAASETRYFYEQLDSYSKTIYDGLEANKENMMSGTYSIEFGDAFSNVLSASNGQEALGEYYQSAVEAFTYDNPDVFYLDPTRMYLNVQTTTRGQNKTYSVHIGSNGQASYLADGFSSEEQVRQCKAQIEDVKDQIINSLSGSTYDRIKQIHDYLVDNINYDQSLSKSNIYNLYGALVNKECVCEGYAKAFKYLLNEAGINSVIVVGIATNEDGTTENHAWNYVDVDGTWYAVDATWDDPIIQGGGMLTHSYKYKYFLVGSSTINSNHTSSGQFTDGGKVFNYPNISSQDYD